MVWLVFNIFSDVSFLFFQSGIYFSDVSFMSGDCCV